MVHLLDPVERLDGGELVGVALSCVHGVHRQVLLQRRVLLEEEGKVREGRGFLGQFAAWNSGSSYLLMQRFYNRFVSKGFKF